MRSRSPISVIIPTLLEEDYLAAILLKLIALEPPLEIIVVDGGSNDKTVEIAERYTDKVYKINGRGISKARNFGAEKANTDILVFLDADVNPPPDFVEKVLRTFEDDRVVGATCYTMPIGSILTEEFFFHFYNLLIRLCASFRPHARGEFLAVKKDEFLMVQGFDESMPCLEDHDLAYRLSKRGRFVFIKDLTVRESMRRFRKLGLAKVVCTWIMDYLSFTFRGKPVSGVWHPVR